MSKTPTYLLIEGELGKDLRRHCTAQWRRGMSWAAIARELEKLTGFAVSSETLRSWFPELKPHLRPRKAVA